MFLFKNISDISKKYYLKLVRYQKAKRLIAFSLLLVLVLALSACQTDEKSNETSKASEKSEIATVKETETSESEASEVTSLPVGVKSAKDVNLRGEALASNELSRPVAVMIDNHDEARPQAGLNQADIVFELPVEGAYTRYMALFQSNLPELVGPVRSVREDFLDRMLEFDSVLVHFGGSYPADQRIANSGYETIDGMVVGSIFFRKNDTGKEAPHNAYADLSEVPEFVSDRNWHMSREKFGYNFNSSPTELVGGQEAHEIVLDINSSNQSSYVYNTDKAVYERYKDGVIQKDEISAEISAPTNIIIQNAKYYVYANTWQKIEQTTKGTAYYISRGKMVPITWEKSATGDLTQYYTEDGNVLVLNPGQTWIHIVNLGVEPQVIN